MLAIFVECNYFLHSGCRGASCMAVSSRDDTSYIARTVSTLQNKLNVVHHALFDAVHLDLHLFHLGLGLGRAIACQVNRLCVVCHVACVQT